MKLTTAQREEVRGKLVATKDTKPVRFLSNGCALDIITGVSCSRGSNVIYHPHYWNFSKAVVKQICEWLGVKAVWSK